MALPPDLASELETLAGHYPERRAALIPALHRCQETLGGWLSPQVIEDVAAFFELEPVEVFGVASFYPMFHLARVGKHVISVCHNISCDLRGAQDVLILVRRIAGIQADEGHGHGSQTSPDGRFTVKTVECQGACANAPMMDVDGTFHEDLNDLKVTGILTRLD